MRRIKLCDICDFQGGSQPPKNQWIDSPQYGYIRMLQIRDFTQSEKVKPEYIKITSSSKVCNEDDILIARYGASVGKILTGLAGAYNVAIMKTIPDEEKISKRFLFHFLSSQYFQNYIMNVGSRAAQAGFNKDDLQGISLKEYSLKEQADICSILDEINVIIKKRKKQLKYIENVVKSRFIEMFDGEYPEETLFNLCNIIDYRGKTPEKVESGLPFITAKNVKMHHMALEPREYISKETYDKVMVRGFPKEGDVVFTTEAPLGNVCRIPHFDTEFYIGQRIVTMQTEELNPIYLEYALSAEEFVRKYMRKSSGSTVKGIRVRLLEQLTIPVPLRVLQDDFANFVLQTDKSKHFCEMEVAA